MINEGMTSNTITTLIKSEMIPQIHKLGPTTPDTWERNVFQALTGHSREDVDWDIVDNQAGYYTWVKSFDRLIQELVEDGFVRVEQKDGSEERTIIPVETGEPINYCKGVYPPNKK